MHPAHPGGAASPRPHKPADAFHPTQRRSFHDHHLAIHRRRRRPDLGRRRRNRPHRTMGREQHPRARPAHAADRRRRLGAATAARRRTRADHRHRGGRLPCLPDQRRHHRDRAHAPLGRPLRAHVHRRRRHRAVQGDRRRRRAAAQGAQVRAAARRRRPHHRHIRRRPA